MTLEVIGADFGRTGTISLNDALEGIGFKPCYHKGKEMKHPEHNAFWQDATDDKAEDWNR